MNLKCIGGAKNGFIHKADNYYQEHDIVPIYGTVEFKLIDFENEVKAFRENRVPDNMINYIHRYKVAAIILKGNQQLKFLIPENWRIEDALNFILGT